MEGAEQNSFQPTATTRDLRLMDSIYAAKALNTPAADGPSVGRPVQLYEGGGSSAVRTRHSTVTPKLIRI